MSKLFHLAIPAGDLDKAIDFYCNVLGCKKGNSEWCPEGGWCDIDFWGNELTLHASISRQKSGQHNVNMGVVLVPHFGVHLYKNEFVELCEKVMEDDRVNVIDKAYIRFGGDILEQETIFIEDPNGNILEFKTMVNPDALFHVEHP